MSLLTVCQEISRDAGFGVPASIISNVDSTAQQLLALANKSGRLLAKRNWQALQHEYLFTSVNGQQTYALPADYDRFQTDTAWNRSAALELFGSLSPQQWQYYKSGVINVSLNSRFRVWLNQIYLDPVPSANGIQYVIEYVSKNWASNAAGNEFNSEFLLDTDFATFGDEYLKIDLLWRFLNRKGLAYAEEKAEAEAEIDRAVATHIPQQPLRFSGDLDSGTPERIAPFTGFGP